MGETLAIVSLVLALPSVIEVVIRVGKDLAQRAEAYEGSLKSFEGLTIFRDEAGKAKKRFELGHKICNSHDPGIDDDIRSQLDAKFQHIQQTINTANELIAKLEKGGLHNLWRLHELRRDFRKQVRLLKDCVSSFNDTINLIHIDQAGESSASLSNEIFQRSADVESVISETTLLVRCHLAQDTNKISAKKGTFLLEVRPYKSFMKASLERSLGFLAKTLIEAEMSACILRTVGYFDDIDRQQLLLVFEVPSALSSMGTLQLLLQTAQQTPALNIRVALCTKLAHTIFEVHNLRLVHKNVNSASVLIMTPNAANVADISDRDAHTFLLNWHLVRKIDAASMPMPERKWWKGIYQHPGRQLTLTEDEYTMGHDIYSLGVCMLEILLWKPLVGFTEVAEPTVHPIFVETALGLGMIDDTPQSLKSFLDDPEDTKDVQRVLLGIADQYLPAAAGQRLTALVKSCVTCLEGGFGDLSFRQGTNRVEVGMNYITAVKNLLSEICV
jgi:hypothetical protein